VCFGNFLRRKLLKSPVSSFLQKNYSWSYFTYYVFVNLNSRLWLFQRSRRRSSTKNGLVNMTLKKKSKLTGQVADQLNQEADSEVPVSPTFSAKNGVFSWYEFHRQEFTSTHLFSDAFVFHNFYAPFYAISNFLIYSQGFHRFGLKNKDNREKKEKKGTEIAERNVSSCNVEKVMWCIFCVRCTVVWVPTSPVSVFAEKRSLGDCAMGRHAH